MVRLGKETYNIKVLVNGETDQLPNVMAALHYFGGYEVFGTKTFGKNVYQKLTFQFLNN